MGAVFVHLGLLVLELEGVLDTERVERVLDRETKNGQPAGAGRGERGRGREGGRGLERR